MPNEAIVLAGGFGSRLKEVVSDRPKPMAEINGRPFLEYLLDYLSGEGISRVVLSVGYMAESVINHFGESYRGIGLSYAVEEVPLGTGGGIRKALSCTKEEAVFVVNGDTYFPVGLGELSAKFKSSKADLVVALYETSESARYWTILTGSGDRITSYNKKGRIMDKVLINGGIYLIKRDIFDKMDFPEKFSFETDFLEKYTETISGYGITFERPFIDIGIPESYERAKTILI